MEIHRGVSLGRSSCCVPSGDFIFTESSHDPGRVLAAHAHRAVNIALVIRGTFLETWSSGAVLCGPGTVLFKPAFHPHSNLYGVDGAHVLYLAPSEPSSLAARSLASLFEGPLGRQIGLSEPLLRIARGQTRDASPQQLIETLLAGLDRRLDVPDWLTRIRLRILQNPESRATLRHLAIASGVSRARLSRSFRVHFGCSIGEYVRRARIQRATQLLLDTDMSQAEIACASGFADQAHLCRLFVRRMGQAPGRYREQYQSFKRNDG